MANDPLLYSVDPLAPGGFGGILTKGTATGAFANKRGGLLGALLGGAGRTHFAETAEVDLDAMVDWDRTV